MVILDKFELVMQGKCTKKNENHNRKMMALKIS